MLRCEYQEKCWETPTSTQETTLRDSRQANPTELLARWPSHHRVQRMLSNHGDATSRRNACANNMGVRSCEAGGGPGIAKRVACFASKFHRRGNGSVASTTYRSHQALGGMAGIVPGAAVATTVVRVIF
jgi:hypothetical protein